ncbi:MAG: FtsQ-type POTRA domain-containing protein [Acidobacteria bacterium]|nr:FtsQ-type POTRA domain-containing protein [Acidobacteriota bacterium]
MATRKRTIKRNTNATAKRRRSTAPRGQSSAATAKFLVPLVFIVGILFCLGILTLMSYRTVTASAFFDVKKIDIRGANRVSKDEIEKIVSRNSEKSGVWNADLTAIRNDIEKIAQVKSAVVSRILPDGLRVNLIEREPRAAVRLEAGDFWADDSAVLFASIGKNESRPPFVMLGWDESKTEKAVKDNRNRVEIYLKMLDEWQDYELAKRVKTVNLSDLQSPQAIIQDSGETITLELAKENFGKRLQKSLEIVAGRGKEIESVYLNGQREILRFRVK